MGNKTTPTMPELRLKAQTVEKLKENRIYTVGQLCDLDEGKLRFWKFSDEQIKEIKTALAKFGLRLIPGDIADSKGDSS